MKISVCLFCYNPCYRSFSCTGRTPEYNGTKSIVFNHQLYRLALADQLFLLMEGAQVTTLTLGVRGPVRNVVPAARALIESELDPETRAR